MLTSARCASAVIWNVGNDCSVRVSILNPQSYVAMELWECPCTSGNVKHRNCLLVPHAETVMQTPFVDNVKVCNKRPCVMIGHFQKPRVEGVACHTVSLRSPASYKNQIEKKNEVICKIFHRFSKYKINNWPVSENIFVWNKFVFRILRQLTRRQCKCKVTLRRCRAITAALEKQ